MAGRRERPRLMCLELRLCFAGEAMFAGIHRIFAWQRQGRGSRRAPNAFVLVLDQMKRVWVLAVPLSLVGCDSRAQCWRRRGPDCCWPVAGGVGREALWPTARARRHTAHGARGRSAHSTAESTPTRPGCGAWMGSRRRPWALAQRTARSTQHAAARN
jgi:hypothetical protein